MNGESNRLLRVGAKFLDKGNPSLQKLPHWVAYWRVNSKIERRQFSTTSLGSMKANFSRGQWASIGGFFRVFLTEWYLIMTADAVIALRL